MQEIGTAQSLKQARRILDEIVLSGGWATSKYGEHAPVYQRKENGAVVELVITRRSDRRWSVIKRKEGE